ncbi:UNVERIFIED_CONTAM: class I SAM-dependent methyltransferase [Methylobacteriaceae bacterium AG10]|nr:class I SAM-dependent methyltransferase [Methylobacteriaceae bacterium AG10]
MYDLAQKVPYGGRIVETGSLYGKSANVWARGAGPDVEVYCFDPWHRAQWIIDIVEGPLGAPEFGLDAFKQYTQDLPNVTPVQGYSPQSAEGWDKPIDLFFEDAVHEDPIFGQNCDFWLEHLKPGGIFCGHDFRLDYHDICKRIVRQSAEWGVPFHVADSFFWMQKPRR